MSNVDFFYEKLNRLKEALGKTKDKEVAEALGIGEKAFNARKTRGSFPEKELRALAQQHPDIALNVDYVLTGKHKPAQERLPYEPDLEARLKAGEDEEGVLRPAHEKVFTPAERDVVALWRRCSLADQALARQMLAWLAARGGE